MKRCAARSVLNSLCVCSLPLPPPPPHRHSRPRQRGTVRRPRLRPSLAGSSMYVNKRPASAAPSRGVMSSGDDRHHQVWLHAMQLTQELHSKARGGGRGRGGGGGSSCSVSKSDARPPALCSSLRHALPLTCRAPAHLPVNRCRQHRRAQSAHPGPSHSSRSHEADEDAEKPGVSISHSMVGSAAHGGPQRGRSLAQVRVGACVSKLSHLLASCPPPRPSA